MNITSRAGWNAKPATKTLYTSWDRRLYVVYHHTGAGDENASVRGIQDWCMNSKGHSDIDYNVLIRNDEHGTIYEGREGIWLTIGSHCLNNNTVSIGVCFITAPGAPLTDAAKAAGRWVFEEAQRRQTAALGSSKLQARVHKDLTETDCPQGVITDWVRAGLPASGVPGPVPAPSSNWTEKIVENLPTQRLNSTGAATRRMQALVNVILAAHNKTLLKEDGEFGPLTDAAVRYVQGTYSLLVDGLCGRNTWTALLTR